MPPFAHKCFSLVRHEAIHTDSLWPRLGLADKIETKYENGLDTQRVVVESVSNSEVAYTLICSNRVMGIMGIGGSRKDPRGGKIWFLGSADLEENVDIELIRESQRLPNFLMQDFEVVYNFVSAENELSIRWLKWCGFEFIRLIPEYGLARKPFWLFAKARTPSLRKQWAHLFNQ
jgi:hypothetical protein